MNHGSDADTSAMLQRVLGDVQPRTLATLARSARTHAFQPRDCLLGEGDEPTVVVLIEGCLAVRRASPDGRRFTLRLMVPGHVAGLCSISGPGPSPDLLVGLTDGRLCHLRPDIVRFCAEADQALAMRLFDLSVEAADLLSERIDEVVFDASRKRLALILLTYERYLSADRPIISRQDLAGLVGTSREMLGSVLRSMEAGHLIARHGRRIEICERAALEREAGWAARSDQGRSLPAAVDASWRHR